MNKQEKLLKELEEMDARDKAFLEEIQPNGLSRQANTMNLFAQTESLIAEVTKRLNHPSV